MTLDELKKELEDLHKASFGWALHHCQGRKSVAEDILQSTYLKILDKKAVYRGETKFKTWQTHGLCHTAD